MQTTRCFYQLINAQHNHRDNSDGNNDGIRLDTCTNNHKTFVAIPTRELQKNRSHSRCYPIRAFGIWSPESITPPVVINTELSNNYRNEFTNEMQEAEITKEPGFHSTRLVSKSIAHQFRCQRVERSYAEHNPRLKGKKEWAEPGAIQALL
jgi:hypothetical protein